MSRLSRLTQGISTPRVPIVWQSAMRARSNTPPLYMTINPQQVQFQQAKRIQRQDTIGGTTFFHFSNRRGQNNDLLTLQISGTTGNIDPRLSGPGLGETAMEVLGAPSGGLLGAISTAVSDIDRTGARENLLAWMSFYQMTLEPILDEATGKPNLVTMTYASPLFPKPVTFTGFFMNVLQFSETATDPFQRQWSVQFTVQRTDPSLDTLVDYFSLQLVGDDVLERAFSLLGS